MDEEIEKQKRDEASRDTHLKNVNGGISNMCNLLASAMENREEELPASS